jgi:hypothetical protein
MAKGKSGESCAEAIKNSIRRGEILTFTDLFNRVQPKGDWSDSTIYQHLMSCVVNLPPARKHWKSRIPFLFLRPDGRYELLDPKVHPEVME